MVTPIGAVRGLLAGIGGLGSLFVRKNDKGSYDIAVGPLVAVALLGSSVTCAIQKDEPFVQCLRSTTSLVKEVVNAF